MSTNGELKRLDQLEQDATRFSAHLYCLVLKEPLDSPRLQRLKKAAETANNRAERRYQASIKAYRATPWR